MDSSGCFRVGAVRFFNARPLIYNLEQHEGIELIRDVPAQLAGELDHGRLDIALIPSIDYQLAQTEWSILPTSTICSSGEVITVRVFSRVPVDAIACIYCDTDSHTSLILARIIWQGLYGRELEIQPLAGPPHDFESVLLIGDKVIPQLSAGWPYQLDLGRAWTEWTGLPFVYAFWAGPERGDMDLPARILQQAYQEGMRNLDQIIDRYGPEHGFSPDLARQYFAENIQFDFGERQVAGLKKFYECASGMKLIETNKPLRFYPFEKSHLPAAAGID